MTQKIVQNHNYAVFVKKIMERTIDENGEEQHKIAWVRLQKDLNLGSLQNPIEHPDILAWEVRWVGRPEDDPDNFQNKFHKGLMWGFGGRR